MRSVTAGMAAPEQGDGTPARMPGGTPSDLSVTALILAIAGALRFGWGQAEPPAGWGLPLVIGMFAAIALAVPAAVAVRRFRHGAAVTGAVSAVAPSAVTGTFGGLVLVAAAATSLRQALPCGRMEGRTAGGLRDG
jgi:hypothetical protein